MSIRVISSPSNPEVISSKESSDSFSRNEYVILDTGVPQGASSFTISNIPQDYDDIRVELRNLSQAIGAGGAEFHATLNGNVNLGSYQYTYADLDSTPSVDQALSTSVLTTSWGYLSNTAASLFNVYPTSHQSESVDFKMTISDYSSARMQKNIVSQSKMRLRMKFHNGIFASFDPVTSIQFVGESAASIQATGIGIDSPRIILYGIKR